MTGDYPKIISSPARPSPQPHSIKSERNFVVYMQKHLPQPHSKQEQTMHTVLPRIIATGPSINRLPRIITP